MTTKTKGFVGGDFLIDDPHPEYSREEFTITNAGGDDISVPAGFPLEADGTLGTATNEADIAAVVIEPIVVPAGESRKVACIARGPCIINRDALPTADLAASPASFDMGDFQTALEALSPQVVVRREPTKQTEHTT